MKKLVLNSPASLGFTFLSKVQEDNQEKNISTDTGIFNKNLSCENLKRSKIASLDFKYILFIEPIEQQKK